MASGRNKQIRAGRAEIEATIRDKIGVGLARLKQRLNAFARTSAAIGGGLIGAAAAGFAPLAAGVNEFLTSGDKFDKIAARTGFAVEDLSRLGFAAGQTGTDVETLEKGLFGVQRFMLALRQGSKTAADSLKLLGLNATDLQNATQIDRLKMFADGLAKIEDAGLRGALAQQMFGRAGRQLLPLLQGGSAGIEEYFKQADKLGITMSTDDATAAAFLADRIDELKTIFKGAAIQVGAALAPELTKLAKFLVGAASGVVQFMRENRRLVVILAAVLGGVAVVGGILVGLGAAAAAVSLAISGISAAAGVVGSVLGAILSPVGLLAAALVAGAYYWLNYTASGQAALAALFEPLRALWDWVKFVFGGIYSAIAEGDWSTAAKIMWTAIKAVWFEALAALSDKWVDFKHSFLEGFRDLLDQAAKTGKKFGLDFVAGAGGQLLFTKTREAVDAGLSESAEDEKARNSFRQTAADLEKELSDLVGMANKKHADAIAAGEFKPAETKELNFKTITAQTETRLSTFSADVLKRFRGGGDTFAKRAAEAGERAADALEKIEDILEAGGELVLE